MEIQKKALDVAGRNQDADSITRNGTTEKKRQKSSSTTAFKFTIFSSSAMIFSLRFSSHTQNSLNSHTSIMLDNKITEASRC